MPGRGQRCSWHRSPLRQVQDWRDTAQGRLASRNQPTMKERERTHLVIEVMESVRSRLRFFHHAGVTPPEDAAGAGAGAGAGAWPKRLRGEASSVNRIQHACHCQTQSTLHMVHTRACHELFHTWPRCSRSLHPHFAENGEQRHSLRVNGQCRTWQRGAKQRQTSSPGFTASARPLNMLKGFGAGWAPCEALEGLASWQQSAIPEEMRPFCCPQISGVAVVRRFDGDLQSRSD